mgnify:CR=1 FL=1
MSDQVKEQNGDWSRAVVGMVASVLISSTAASYLTSQQASSQLREQAATMGAQIRSLEEKFVALERGKSQLEAENSRRIAELATAAADARALEARVRLLESWSERTQGNQFTATDAERFERVMDLKIDELRRRMIVLEQNAFGRNLDGTPQQTR